MKKWISIFLVLLLTLGLALAQAQQPDDAKRLQVVTTIFAPYDFVRAITGGQADITMLLPPASESHSFEPTPRDIIKVQSCDVFIYTGGNSDQWISEILASMDTSGMTIIKMLDCVSVVTEEIVEGMEDDAHDHEEDHEDEEGHEDEEDHEDEDSHEVTEVDEHVWTSPRNAMAIVERIAEVLCQADPANAALYQQNETAYLAGLETLDGQLRAAAEGGIRKTLVFGDRFPFRYFVDAYGLDYFAAFPGCSTETEPSAATVAFLIDKIKAEGIPVVLHIELTNGKMAEAISEATGAQVLQLHSCHNISKTDFEAGKTYIELMSANVDVLKEALY